MLVKRLDALGFQVFATTRNPSAPNVVQLKQQCSPRLHVIPMDVRQDDQIKEAVQYVTDHLNSAEFWCLVNNAGVMQGTSIELTTTESIADVLNVNTMGFVRVAKAFLPLLRRSKGRVVNITSPLGKYSFPYAATYVLSKFANQGFHFSLKQEMQPWGVKVVAVEPGLFRTSITELQKHAESEWSKLDPVLKKDYGEGFVLSLQRILDFLISMTSPKTGIAVEDIVSAVTSQEPRGTYKPRTNVLFRLAYFVVEHLPDDVRHFVFSMLFWVTGVEKPGVHDGKAA